MNYNYFKGKFGHEPCFYHLGMLKSIKSILFLLSCIISLSGFIVGHSGGTDSQGGHFNRRTGEYHFHHGRPAHQHPNGICPYSSGYSASTTSTSTTNSSPKDNSFIIFLAIASGFGLYHLMKYKNKKRVLSVPQNIPLKTGSNNNVKPMNNDIKNIACPSCKQGFLILRNGRYGTFLGCSRYPRCRHTKSVKL